MEVTIKIPQRLKGKDIWVKEPPYTRKDGAKFHMDDELSNKDLEYLMECGIPLARLNVGMAKKKVKKDK